MKRFGIITGIFVLAMGLFAVTTTPTAYAAGRCNAQFLTFPTWYRGLTRGDCTIKSPSAVGGLSNFIWKIALNVLEILLQLVGYIAVAFIIYGGFRYLTSTGSSDKIAGAKKTILNAVIGLILSFFSVAIVSIISRNIG